MVYGYVRISTHKQNPDRQIRNIKEYDKSAVIVQEIYTGTTFQGRKKLEAILRLVKSGDVIIFDSVSRMSRNAEEGYQTYELLYYRGITLVFLKERHIDTEVLKRVVAGSIALTGTNADYIIEGINKYLLALAKEQIKIAFEQAEKEVADLRQRTKEGIATARLNGKQIGQPQGCKLITKKSIAAKEKIKHYAKDFGGDLNDQDVMKIVGVSKNTYYKYKREIKSIELS